MVGKNQIKQVRSLHQKKYRNQKNLFFVEGIKVVMELLNAGFVLEKLYATKANLALFYGHSVEEITAEELVKMSALRTPNGVLAVFQMPEKNSVPTEDWVVALDDVRDPGNLGTIIRLCDWYGIKNMVCSSNTVDCFNPKVLQATMGSIARVSVHYTELSTYLKDAKLPIYGTFIQGKSVYEMAWPTSGILVMGNEAHGISPEISALVTKQISIPQYGEQSAESLNVSTATGILLNELRRF